MMMHRQDTDDVLVNDIVDAEREPSEIGSASGATARFIAGRESWL